MCGHVVGFARFVLLLAIVALVGLTLGQAQPTSAQASPLSVVFLDASKPSGTMLSIVATDGSSKRVVGELLGPGLRVLDLRAGLLAATDGDLLVTVNLASGATKRLTVGDRIQSAYVANASAVFYSTHPGCGPVEKKALIGRFNPATETSDRVADMGTWPGSEVLRYSPDADELTVASRSCDPGVAEVWLINAKSGETKQKVPVDGCGAASISPTGGQVLLSYDLCKLGGRGAFPDLRVYALPSGDMTEARFNQDAPSRRPFVYAPDGKRVAYGLALDRDGEAGGATSGGIWTLDTASLERTKLWQDQGQESWAIAWSPDGSKLLVASKHEENTCTYSVLDVPSGQASAIPDLTGCDQRGTLVGFFAQP